MKVSFVTSGFPNGFTSEFICELRKYLSPINNQLAFVASDFKVHERTSKYKDIFVRFFTDHGIVFSHVVIVDDNLTPDEAIDVIRASNVVWLAGGPTLTQIADIKRNGLINALRERDGITIGMSAGSINMAKRVVLAKDHNDNVPELTIYEGIGLVEFNIEPHIDAASEKHMSDVLDAAKISPIIGLPNNSFIVDINGNYSLFGPYRMFRHG